MIILIAADTYFPDINGASVFTRQLAEGLAQREHEVHVVAPSPRSSSYVEVNNGVRIHRVPSRKYPFHATFHVADPRRVRQNVFAVLDEVQPDVMHAQSHFVVGRTAIRQASRAGLPTIATNHFMPENLLRQTPLSLPNLVEQGASWLAWRDAGRVLRDAEVVTAPTPHAVGLLARLAAVPNAIPISNGVDVARFATRRRRATETPTVLYVGRLDAEKHVDVLIAALASLPIQVRLRVVGDGGQRQRLERQVRQLDLTRRVDFVGFVSDLELVQEYQSAVAFCMLGTAELQSLATMEAMASGLPVVAADAHALPHLVVPGVNGALVRPGDVQATVDALRPLVADSELRDRYGAASKTMVARHDLSSTIAAYEVLYREAFLTPSPVGVPRSRILSSRLAVWRKSSARSPAKQK